MRHAFVVHTLSMNLTRGTSRKPIKSDASERPRDDNQPGAAPICQPRGVSEPREPGPLPRSPEASIDMPSCTSASSWPYSWSSRSRE